MPIDFGFRNNTNFWFSRHSNPYSEPIPKEKGVNVDSVMYASTRYDPDVEWTIDACEKIVKVPRIFLKTVIKGCVEAAKEEGFAFGRTVAPGRDGQAEGPKFFSLPAEFNRLLSDY